MPERDQSTARADLEVARVAARQHGVVSIEDLRACGLSNKAISVRVANGRLHPLHRGVYAVGHANPTLEGCYAGGGHGVRRGRPAEPFLGGGAARTSIRWEDRYPDVLVLGPTAPQHPRINGHRTSYLPPEHVTTWRGIPITTAAADTARSRRRAHRGPVAARDPTVAVPRADHARVARGGAQRAWPQARPQDAREGDRDRRGADPERARGHGAGPDPARWLRTPCGQCAVVPRGPPDRAGLPLARAAARHRGRRAPPRRPVRTGGGPRTTAHPGGTRLPGDPHHLDAGDPPPRQDAAPHQRRRAPRGVD